MKAKANYLLVFVAFLMTLGLAACSSGPTKLAVTTTEMVFSPKEWTLPAGKQVELTLTNNGALDHEWVLIKKGEQVTPPFDADDEPKVFWEMEAEPGKTKTETFTAPAEAGEYQVVCGTPGHFEAGMVGKATVK